MNEDITFISIIMYNTIIVYVYNKHKAYKLTEICDGGDGDGGDGDGGDGDGGDGDDGGGDGDDGGDDGCHGLLQLLKWEGLA